MSAIIDFLSFSWTPEELAQIFDLTKMGASIKAIRGFEFNEYGDNVTHQALDTAAIDYKAAINAKLRDTEFAIGTDSRKFHEIKRDMLDHFGLNTLDCLCRGEVDRFINRLNHGLGLFGNDWSFSLRSGGFSGYPHSANILVNGQQAGLCAWGAKNHGCYISFSGTGTAVLDLNEVYRALHELPGAKITRVDIAFDSLDGKYNIKTARKMAEHGEFITRGRPASYCYIESGHMSSLCNYQKSSGKEETVKKRYGFVADKGKSFYVGTRDAGKLLRVYEKGKQLKSEEHKDWVRWELELRAKDRVLPFDVLLTPDKYLAGAYPALGFVSKEEQCMIATHKRKWFTSVDNAVRNGATQCGKLVNFMRQCLDLDDSQIVNMLTNHLESHEIPNRLNQPVYQETENSKDIRLRCMKLINPDNHDIYSLA
ncbi:replication initiation factor domain-containing protein [Photobacterium sp. ZSDE20]|uniref:Replication initiation factor domain-containing protein n=1 Tax=Photobacterium pectinilyticum TaxID=2906793 RepID=A0ABT1MXB6_9GAMM|nr:replication initiation factor domain-containing protein [Photobacterium sp. ZSDE20]MCQ1056927.1 replication initiation factor domain-containing protein [Photobacterium sp. ZSDE20]MDD1821062.1 replication initiation factor domain-containing protein [Photobacterium sp. ZSDE20]